MANLSKPGNALADFTIATARPLPVIVLADVSGSMSEMGKIDALNAAITEMVKSFAAETQERAEIQVAVITFGSGGAKLHCPLTPARSVTWSPACAAGGTPLGGAIDLAARLVEDRDAIPARAYRPAIVLVSDGQPTDEWQQPLAKLFASERAAKADRFALAIGADADLGVLATFLADASKPVLKSTDARQVMKFFRWVTMSVTARSKSATPNAYFPPLLPDLSDDDF